MSPLLPRPVVSIVTKNHFLRGCPCRHKKRDLTVYFSLVTFFFIVESSIFPFMFKRIYRHYKESYSGLSPTVWLLAGVTLINRSGTSVLFFMMLYLTGTLHFSPTEAGALLSLYGLGAMAGSWLGGHLSDRIGTKSIQLFSLFIGGASYLVLSEMRSTFFIGLLLFLVALLIESFRPASATALGNACRPEQRARAYALNRLAINFGVALGPALGGFLAVYDYAYIFWLESGTSIMAGFLLLFFFQESPVSGQDRQHEIPRELSPWRDKVFIRVFILMLLTGIIFNQLFNTWPMYLKETVALTEERLGLLLTFNALIIVSFEMAIVHHIRRYKMVRMIAWGIGLMCLGFGMVSWHDGYPFLILTVIIWSIGEMLAFPLLSAFIANRADDRRRGAYMGATTFSFSASFVIGPILGPYIYSRFGAFFLWNGIVLLGLLIMTGFLRLERQL